MDNFGKFRPFLILAAASLAMTGCGTLPNNGPVAAEVVNQSANKTINNEKAETITYELVDVTTALGETVSAYRPRVFNSTFGMGSRNIAPTIGVGDVLQVTIFEAGPDGLFSTVDNKSTPITAVVQPDGNAAIPYVGQVKFAGNQTRPDLKCKYSATRR